MNQIINYLTQQQMETEYEAPASFGIGGRLIRVIPSMQVTLGNGERVTIPTDNPESPEHCCEFKQTGLNTPPTSDAPDQNCSGYQT